MNEGLLITKERALDLLTQLGEKLREGETYAVIDVYGGVAMSVLYFDLRSSYDIDIVLHTEKNAGFWKAAGKVAAANGLEKDWLNEGVPPIIAEDLKISLLTG
jgi:hypothetical protein